MQYTTTYPFRQQHRSFLVICKIRLKSTHLYKPDFFTRWINGSNMSLISFMAASANNLPAFCTSSQPLCQFQNSGENKGMALILDGNPEIGAHA